MERMGLGDDVDRRLFADFGRKKVFQFCFACYRLQKPISWGYRRKREANREKACLQFNMEKKKSKPIYIVYTCRCYLLFFFFFFLKSFDRFLHNLFDNIKVIVMIVSWFCTWHACFCFERINITISLLLLCSSMWVYNMLIEVHKEKKDIA